MFLFWDHLSVRSSLPLTRFKVIDWLVGSFIGLIYARIDAYYRLVAFDAGYRRLYTYMLSIWYIKHTLSIWTINWGYLLSKSVRRYSLRLIKHANILDHWLSLALMYANTHHRSCATHTLWCAIDWNAFVHTVMYSYSLAMQAMPSIDDACWMLLIDDAIDHDVC